MVFLYLTVEVLAAETVVAAVAMAVVAAVAEAVVRWNHPKQLVNKTSWNET